MPTGRLIFFVVIITTVAIRFTYSLKCRTEDGPSDGELKRVARSCMRKFGDIAFAQNSQQQGQQQTQFYAQQLHHQQSQARYRQRGYNYEDSEEGDNDEFDDDNYRNYNRQQHGYNGNNNNSERVGGHNEDRQRNRNRHNNGTSNGNPSYNWNYSNQRNPLGSSTSNRGTTSNNNNRNRNNNNNNGYGNNNTQNNSSDVACIVHCFFVEMHMLNSDDYPDRHKMLYILTKNIRDRELRNFYTDTIQECFRYLENQRRREKCQFSRDLIMCMTEYAKGNCDDWNEFNMMFN